MQQAQKLNIRRRLLQLAMNAALVLSVLSFSGQVSQAKPGSFELARTELTHTKWNTGERSTRMKIAGHTAFSESVTSHQPNDFCASLFHYGRQLEVKLKINSRTHVKKNDQFFMHVFTYSSECPDSDTLKGKPFPRV
jgi:hypothetical protein